jgi:hypothetical protein
MQHAFELEPLGPRSILHQRFEASGLLMPFLWTTLRPGMMQFAQLGTDLADHLRR